MSWRKDTFSASTDPPGFVRTPTKLNPRSLLGLTEATSNDRALGCVGAPVWEASPADPNISKATVVSFFVCLAWVAARRLRQSLRMYSCSPVIDIVTNGPLPSTASRFELSHDTYPTRISVTGEGGVAALFLGSR